MDGLCPARFGKFKIMKLELLLLFLHMPRAYTLEFELNGNISLQ